MQEKPCGMKIGAYRELSHVSDPVIHGDRFEQREPHCPAEDTFCIVGYTSPNGANGMPARFVGQASKEQRTKPSLTTEARRKPSYRRFKGRELAEAQPHQPILSDRKGACVERGI